MSAGGTYDPHAVEPRIYAFWEAHDQFGAAPDGDAQPYSIVIPPPNVTGMLHLGHALNNTLQDVLIRTHRMRGYNTVWLPGTDHAGIATQAVVEKRLRTEEGKTRHEIGRDGLIERIWAWKEDYNNRILNQLRTMGCSCDWSRTRFTLDDRCARAVHETFFRFFKDGLIFRGKRLVNWDTKLQTAVADDEIQHEKVKGHLWHFRYPILADDTETQAAGEATDVNRGAEPTASLPDALLDKHIAAAAGENAALGQDYLSIATTRPETMLGDTAVAVHPDDPRHQHLIGKYVLLPLSRRAIPVIADGELVDPEFGTGCVKVTPGHDPNDYDCGLRNNLAFVDILNDDGTINAAGGTYAGVDKDDARKQVVADMESLGLLDKIEDYQTEIGHSDRSKAPIEPRRSDQWFMRMGAIADPALDAVRDGRVQFFPERYAKSFLDWLGEKRDWCISRQLWWGHRIPVWTLRGGANAQTLRDLEQNHADELFCAATDDVDVMHACLRDPESPLAAEIEKLGATRDDDVLDTWFSSALWPFSTWGWPEETADLTKFYPTSVLCTARDIISLWVARMVVTGLYNVGQVPFPHVYIHPVIQDGHGQRMSKSAGNGLDPLDLVAQFGADAMRFTLTQFAGETQDVRVPVKQTELDDGREVNTSDRFELGRNFCNKLWQMATGFVFPNLEHYDPRPLDVAKLPVEDRWIVSRLAACVAEVDRRMARYQFNEIANTLYAFFWSELCDWYVELIKPRLSRRDDDGTIEVLQDESARQARQVLAYVLDQTLRLLHPIAPFITEELWQNFAEIAPRRGLDSLGEPEPALIRAAWPDAAALPRDEEVEREMDALQEIIRAVRDVRTRVNALRSQAGDATLKSLPHAVVKADAAVCGLLNDRIAMLQRLSQCDAFEIGPDAAKPPDSASKVISSTVEVYVPLGGIADLDMEKQRLTKERNEIAGHLKRVEGKLANAKFVENAPAAVVEQERGRAAELKAKLAAIEQNLAELG